MFRSILGPANVKHARLLEMMAGDMTEANEAFSILGKQNFPIVRTYLLKNGGSDDDAREMLQSSLVELVELVRDQRLPRIQNVHAYLVQMCKNRWLNHQRKARRQQTMDPEAKQSWEDPDQDPFRLLEEEDIRMWVKDLLGKLGKNCRPLLIWSLGEGVDMKQVAEKLDYQNAQTAMNLKARCKRELLKLVGEHPAYQQRISQILLAQ
ncbi:MAG: sigma-70 family RNA polymerase sigma factor [Bacteroidota bacterium]